MKFPVLAEINVHRPEVKVAINNVRLPCAQSGRMQFDL